MGRKTAVLLHLLAKTYGGSPSSWLKKPLQDLILDLTVFKHGVQFEADEQERAMKQQDKASRIAQHSALADREAYQAAKGGHG